MKWGRESSWGHFQNYPLSELSKENIPEGVKMLLTLRLLGCLRKLNDGADTYVQP